MTLFISKFEFLSISVLIV